MLHLILGILKIAGIILLVLLLLVIALILSVLFVPIRYRLIVAFTDQKKRGEVRVSWLLHLISLRAVVELPAGEEEPKNTKFELADMQTHLLIRVLGVDLFAVRDFFVKRRSKRPVRKKRKEKKASFRAMEKQSAGKQQAQQSDEHFSGKRRTQEIPEEPVPEKKRTLDMPEKASPGDKQSQPDREASSDKAEEEQKQDDRTKNTLVFSQFFRNLLYKLRQLCVKITQIPERIKRLTKKIKSLLKKPGQLSGKIQKFFRKLDHYKADEVVQECWWQIRKLLHHYRVRKAVGYLRFGTGDPSFTGELTGVLYLVLPVSCREFRIEPQFTDSVFETEMDLSGHVRVVHLVTTGWWVFRNKKLRRLIRAFR